MIDQDVALAGLSALCNANVTSIQKVRSQDGASAGNGGGPARQQLFVNNFISSVVAADETCKVSRNNFDHLKRHLEGDAVSQRHAAELQRHAAELQHRATELQRCAEGSRRCAAESQGFATLSFGIATPLLGFARPSVGLAGPSPVIKTPLPGLGPGCVIDEEEFFQPEFDYDFTGMQDTVTYYRGEEKYERPCGWKRLAIKVLDKYSDGNAWLGNQHRSTESVPGEWPVSYHGTSRTGAAGIIKGFYEPGPRKKYGRGIYSTPDISEAEQYYAKTFTIKGKEYKVILQNRINPEIRKKCNNGQYWLIPIDAGTSKEDEENKVQENIRPYGLLLKEV